MHERDLLIQLFRSQAYRELAAARLFEQALPLAPDEAARVALAEDAREERAHLDAVLRLWGEETGTPRAALLAEVEARVAARPLPRAETWLDVAMARFLYDRAGFWQLRECEGCAHARYAALVRTITAEEAEHQAAGAGAVVALCAAAGGTAAQAAFERWLRPALLSFGRAGTAASARAIAAGWKRRDPAAVTQDFIDDVRPVVQTAGLRFPPPQQLGLELPASLRW